MFYHVFPTARGVFQHYKPEDILSLSPWVLHPTWQTTLQDLSQLGLHPPSWPHCLFLPHSSLLVSLPRVPCPLISMRLVLSYRLDLSSRSLRCNWSSFSPPRHSLLWAILVFVLHLPLPDIILTDKHSKTSLAVPSLSPLPTLIY